MEPETFHTPSPEELRLSALDMAIRCCSHPPVAEDIVKAAKTFETFLKGA